VSISSQMNTGAKDVGGALHDLPPVPADRAAVAMSTAHMVNDIGNELAHAEERMKAARKSGGDMRRYHTLHYDNHLKSAMEQAELLKDNMMAHYPAEAAEWAALNQVMDLAGYSLNKRSGMISLDIPPGTIPTTPNGVEDHHITVVYLGKDVDDEAYAEACRRAREAAFAMPGPLSGTVGGVGTFPPDDEGMTPAWAGVVLPGAERIRSALEDLSASQHKDWRPHVTLAMLDPGEPLPDPVPPTPVTFTHLTVHRGSDVMRYPLGGGPVEMSKSVNPVTKAASFAHLLQTIKYDGAHARRHSTAMLADTDDKAWNFDADHAEKHTHGAHEHARKLAEHIADNYPQEAGFLKELTKKEDLSMENISSQALALSFDSSVHPRGPNGRFVHMDSSYHAASHSSGGVRISAPHTASMRAPHAPSAAPPPASMRAASASNVKVAASVYTQQRVYTDKEVGKALDEIKKLRDQVEGEKHTEPRARLAVRIGVLTVGVVIAALTAGAALPVSVALAIPLLHGVAGEVAEFHVAARGKGARFVAHPLQTLNPRRPNPQQLSNEPGDVTEQAIEVLATVLMKEGLSPDVAQQTAQSMVDQWMQTEGWRLTQAPSPGNITEQINTIQFADESSEPPPFRSGESGTITGQAVELGKFQDNWMHEMRGAHGEWSRSPGGPSGSPEPAYKVPPHARLINPRSSYPDPSDHPFFKAHPMKAEHVLHAYSMASEGQKAQGMRWYADAGLVAGAIAHGDQHKGAGLLSAYSPQTSWPVNMFNAARSVELGRPIGPGEGTTAMTSHANAAQKIMDGKSFDEALPAPKTNAFAKLIEQKGEDSPHDPYGEVVIDRHALSVAAGERLGDKEKPPIGDDRYYQVVADEYRKAAVAASKREGRTISPSQMQAITWLVQQSANDAEDAANKSSAAKGRATATANAWKKWISHAQANNIQTASGTTALSMLHDVDDTLEIAMEWALELRDAKGRWTKGGGGGSALAEHVKPEGFSLDPKTGKAPSHGYMVSLPGHTHQYPDSVMKDKHQLAAAIDKFLMDEREVFKNNPNAHLGGWVSDGKLWLDPSENIADQGEAIRAGKARDQVAIWDVVGGKEIDTAGTGGSVTEHSAPGVFEYPPWLRGYA
jgi:hypothetical protein